MIENLQVFQNENFSNLTTITREDGTIIFSLEDLIRILELSKQQSLIDRLTDYGIFNVPVDGKIKVFVDESNLYKCIFQSRKKEAEKFQEWVTKEVLPSIRKHGAYFTGDKLMEILNDPRKMADILINLANERDLRIKAQKELEVAKPKLDHYDRIIDSKNLQTTTVLSRSFEMTAQALNKLLLKLGVIRKLYNSGSVYGFTAKYEGKDYGNIKDLPIFKKDGRLVSTKRL